MILKLTLTNSLPFIKGWAFPKIASWVVEGRFFLESSDIIQVGTDFYDRELYLGRAAAKAWIDMQSAALGDGVTLTIVSGFRSVRTQEEIIRQKLEAGQQLFDILRENAAPGYSQHHTGLRWT